ncbi:MAG: hypothetical protein WCP06_02510 [Verrucomicrobiota bacterium]
MGNKKSQPPVQAGGTGKAGEVAAVVGDLHSSVDLWAMADEFRQSIAERSPREVTCSMRASGSEGEGMAGASRIETPDKVRSLQIALYRKAKAEPRYYRNSSAVMDEAMTYARDRLRRWVWRKHACSRGIWKHYPDARLHNLYGLYEMPIAAGWKAKR